MGCLVMITEGSPINNFCSICGERIPILGTHDNPECVAERTRLAEQRKQHYANQPDPWEKR